MYNSSIEDKTSEDKYTAEQARIVELSDPRKIDKFVDVIAETMIGLYGYDMGLKIMTNYKDIPREICPITWDYCHLFSAEHDLTRAVMLKVAHKMVH